VSDRVYLDYNATAPVRPEVRDAVEPLIFGYGNPSSIHWAGRDAKRHLEAARRELAALFDRKASEVVFTSGGSEADNLAIVGALQPGDHLALSAVEHPAVREAAAAVADRGVTVTTLGVDGEGHLDLDAVDRALEGGATLISVMAVNNETGVISPLDEVIARAHSAGAKVHVDAVQAVGRIGLPKHADLITISGHKLGGLVGAGALITREGLPLAPQIRGGAQERGRRAGTESVAAIVALATAARVADAQRVASEARLAELGASLEAALATIPGVRILGEERVAGVITALFDDIEGESLLIALDLAGVAASSGSACASGSLEASEVLLAMGIDAHQALATVRFSMGWATTEADLARVCDILPDLVRQARQT